MPDSLLAPDFLRRLEALEFAARRARAGRLAGERRSRRRGRGVEFADFRPYAPGDDLRHLDWNLFARLERPFLRLFLEDEDLHVSIFVDASPSMRFGSPTKLRYAQQAAAALGCVGLRHHDRVTLESVGVTQVKASGPFRGRAALRRLLAFAESLGAPAAPAPLGATLRAAAARSPGRGVCVVLSDFWDKAGAGDGLAALAAKGLEVVAVQVLAPDEWEPTLTGDARLIDSEDGDAAEVSAGAALFAAYRRELAAYQGELRRLCAARGAAFVAVNAAEPVERLLLRELRGVALR